MPHTMELHEVLSWTAKVPLSLTKEATFHGTPDDVVDQVAEWRDNGLRYLLVVNGGALQPRLRKSAQSVLPFLTVLRKLKKLSAA